ncbi:MAG: type IX secretion system sortase PorU [Prevotella sp.]|jgi:hypothetical protein
MKRILFLLILLVTVSAVHAQRFFNLTSDEVRVDSTMPSFGYSIPLSGDYQDSVYTATILYPEFIDMTSTDIANYRRMSQDSLPELPVVDSYVAVSQKQASFNVAFCPLVYRDGRYQILVSFMLRIDSWPVKSSVRRSSVFRSSSVDRYAAHSVLASGNWAKIRVPSSGFYQLTDAVIQQAGFTDINKVHIYGYGGNLQNETLNGDELYNLDDLKEVEQCIVGGRHVFYAKGPVSWSSNTTTQRTRNPYSDYGYYFITQNDSAQLTVDSATFMSSHYPTADDYHSLYEVDGFAWYTGGRNLFDTDALSQGETKTIVLTNSNAKGEEGKLYVRVTSGTASATEVTYNGETLGTLTIRSMGTYDHGKETHNEFSVTTNATDTLKLTVTEGGPVRLDYAALTWETPKPSVSIASASLPVPEYVYNIVNQDHHADSQVDMVIIIPTSQKLLSQAQRLKTFHEQNDGISVRIVPADELFNEFSSGTPDANAYRRYLKMLYDRATSADDAPKYLLLFGDCLWDNRMISAAASTLSPDDYLLCWESENSFSEIYCYVDDGFFCLLDDGEGLNPATKDKLDVAVGRFPVTTEEEATIMVDKTIAYAQNRNGGDWANVLMFLGDDGNNNLHMRDVNAAAEDIASLHPGYEIKKVMWDAYPRVSTSTGYRYPGASEAIKKQQAAGALIFDYAGHGIEYQISHEAVLTLSDFREFTNENLPLWITASCDIMPFDGTAATIGEAAVLNANGGAVAFYGTTRTVYADANKRLNMAFLRRVLSIDTVSGKPTTMGEAQRLAKNDMIINSDGDRTINKLQYSLLGDPALPLNLPTYTATIDSIDGTAVANATTLPQLKAGATVRVAGHVEDANDFNGTVSLTVRDNRELITCLQQEYTAQTAFQYYDRPKTLFNGTDSIRGGKFSMTFTVPKDINYSNETGQMIVYAISSSRIAHGSCESFTVGGTAANANDTIGPDVYCYLNTPEFVDGGDVNTTPYFVANISDSSGINTTGTGIGHDLQLIIDGDATMTYTLNENFTYDFGSHTTGSTWYSIPELEPGAHWLQFRAWDQLNNSTTKRLNFNVVKGLQPSEITVSTTDNPATTETTFIVGHNLIGSAGYVKLEVFDASGRLLWRHSEDTSTTPTLYTYTWDLRTDTGARLQTGVYLYRVSVSVDGSVEKSKTKKLIVIGNN